MKAILLGVSLLFSPFLAVAQTQMSLKECVQYGLSHDLTVQKQQLELDYTKAQEKEARSSLYPTINGKVQVQHFLDIPVSLLPGEILGQPGVQIPVKFGTSDNMTAGLEAQQILYNHTVMLSTKAVRAAAVLGKLSVEKAREQVVYNIAQSYINLQVLRKQYGLLELNIDKIKKTLRILQVSIDNGFAKQIDADKLLVAQNNLETEVQNLRNLDEQLQMALKFSMNMPLATELTLTDSLNTSLLAKRSSVASQNIDQKLLLAQKDLLGIQNEVVHSGYYPSAAAFASYQVQAQRNKVNFYDTQLPWFRTSVIGLQINVPIFDGFLKKAKIQQGSIRIKQLDLDAQNLTNAINFQQQLAAKKIIRLQSAMVAHDRNIALAQKVVNLTQDQINGGFATAIELINAQSALREARTNKIKADADIRLAELELIKSEGRIVEEF